MASTGVHTAIDTQAPEIADGIDIGVRRGTKKATSTLVAPTRDISVSTTDQRSDAASTRSVPDILVTDPSSPDPLSTPNGLSGGVSITRSRSPHPVSSRVHAAEGDVLSPVQRILQTRFAFEARSSNRLSSFFNGLMHRREHLQTSASSETIIEGGNGVTEEVSPAQSKSPSRASSPQLMKSLDLPPPLPPPTLQELGLTLSALTLNLSSSHFSTPPTSGAFLAPHYLLLCHAQGLDVLPLVSPPAPQPYALVRRVNFKSVVVMEQRGVLVAIAGRRDGVRVYALEEVKKSVEWRIDVEVKRERDRLRRDALKKIAIRTFDFHDVHGTLEKPRETPLSTSPLREIDIRNSFLRERSHSIIPLPPVPLIPREALQRTPFKKSKPPSVQQSQALGNPPPYSGHSDISRPPHLQSQRSSISISSRGPSLGHTLRSPSRHRSPEYLRELKDCRKSFADWMQSSDDEAIDIVAAGVSGSQALDERTSVATHGTTTSLSSVVPIQTSHCHPRSSLSPRRRDRPSNLDLTLTLPDTFSVMPASEPSPAPTLLTLRQALSNPSFDDVQHDLVPNRPVVVDEIDEEEVESSGHISLTQALLESRLPDIPPAGTIRPQEPILLSNSRDRVSDAPSTRSARSLDRRSNAEQPSRRRRRWSIMLGSAVSETFSESSRPSHTPIISATTRVPGNLFNRSPSFRSSNSHSPAPLPLSQNESTLPNSGFSSSASLGGSRSRLDTNIPGYDSAQMSRSSGFISRFIGNAFVNRRSEERPPSAMETLDDSEGLKRSAINQPVLQVPAPKLDYVKLPGTKGAISIKAVETAKKSFLAILCGDNGEKVELFAGTYRTALGLSRTFILPDSPRSLELQLQGDDLVEVFLVFSQNVFGLEPATVRVREVRIGRAERRAARRRARGARLGERAGNEPDGDDDDINVNFSIGLSVALPSNSGATTEEPERASTPPLMSSEYPDAHSDQVSTPAERPTRSSNITRVEELVALATAQMGPYTTFQQLSFAPNFPLASIADDYIIPPTYSTFLEYRNDHEPSDNGSNDFSQMQFSPPGLPLPTPSAPSKWYYRDPKGNVHGPWKAILMQAWYKEGLLPSDLPVRREEETEYVLLKDLRLTSVDNTQPFRSPPVATTSTPFSLEERPLLPPISMLAQPQHFGPPALFFSSRGGHSTAIVDSRGRSVLKGRFVWSNDDSNVLFRGRMGDVKRLEAFDVKDRSVLVAMRQGGLEALDLSDALLKPADQSRTNMPCFFPPPSQINRRAPFVWKIGTPVSTSSMNELDLPPNRSRGGVHGYLPGKKNSTASTKVHVGKAENIPDEFESDVNDEMLYLGRKDNELYICERNPGSFRILRLSPNPS